MQSREIIDLDLVGQTVIDRQPDHGVMSAIVGSGNTGGVGIAEFGTVLTDDQEAVTVTGNIRPDSQDVGVLIKQTSFGAVSSFTVYLQITAEYVGIHVGRSINESGVHNGCATVLPCHGDTAITIIIYVALKLL